MSHPKRPAKGQKAPGVRANTTGLAELHGALPATRCFPGKELIRSEIGRALGKRRGGNRKADTQ
jgi:hypothetical protein